MIRLMLVDDEPSATEYLSAIIRQYTPEFEVAAIAENGGEALKALKTQPCDIVISDISMPVMDGMALAEALQHAWPWVRCVLVSGYQDFVYAQQAIRFGVSDYLLKPVNHREFISVLQKLAIRIDCAKQLKEIVQQNGNEQSRSELLSIEQDISQAIISHCDIHTLKTKLNGIIEAFAGRMQSRTPEDPLLKTFQSIANYIQENLNNALPLQSLCRHCGVSQKTLNRLMRKYVHCTYIEYLTQQRIQRAKEIMAAHPDTSIAVIASSVSYEDPLYFSRVFKNEVGCPPSEYVIRVKKDL